MRPNRKLTDEQVREIRNNPLPPLPLAKHDGVSSKTIRAIKNREYYKDVGENADE